MPTKKLRHEFLRRLIIHYLLTKVNDNYHDIRKITANPLVSVAYGIGSRNLEPATGFGQQGSIADGALFRCPKGRGFENGALR